MKDNPKGQGIRKSLLVLLSLFLLPGAHALVDQAGWPKDIGGMVVSSPALADLDGDGDFEVIIGADDGTVYAWHGDGSNAAGWPKSMGYSVLSSPAVGDLDGDGDLEVVAVSTRTGGKAPISNIYAWHHNGALIWTKTVDASIISSPALADLDGDGDFEIVLGAEDNNVYAWHHDGTTMTGWPKTTGGKVQSSPALADLDRDGDLEVVAGSEDGNVYAWHHDGALYWSAAIGTVHDSSPAIADLDGDGDLEIVIGSAGGLYVLDYGGNMQWSSGIKYSSSPALADLDGAGGLEIVVGTSDLGPGNKVHAFYNDGTVMWSKQLEQGDLVGYREKVDSSPTIGDLDGDGSVEIVVATTVISGGSLDSGTIYAWNSDGTLDWSEPISGTNYYLIESSPALGDIDGDGDIEVIVGSMDGKVHAWDMSGAYDPDSVKWGMFRHDARHEGTLVLNNNLDIVQAQTDSAIYLLGENAAISCRVQDYYGIATSADSVVAAVDKPDGSSGTVTLQEGSPGYYTGTFTTTLIGAHTVTINANKAGYAGATAGLSFNVTLPFWHYTVPVTVNAGASERVNVLIDAGMNFTQKLLDLGVAGTFDINSPRVFETDAEGNDLQEVPSQFEKKAVEVGTTNIALGKTATASAEYSSSYSAGKAVDGSSSTYWAGTGDHSDWLKVDLGEPTNIAKIVMTGVQGKYYPRNFTIQVSTDDVSYTVAREEIGNTDYPYTHLFSPMTYGRYVKLDVTQNNGFWRTVVSELEIYSGSGEPYVASTNAAGDLKWIMDGTTSAGTTRYYHIDFDTLDAGAKPAPDYGIDYSALVMPSGMTITIDQAEIIELPNISPAASITSPANGSQYGVDDSITFTGVCTDTDGTIESYAWNSSIDGALNSASSFSTSDLSVGTHVATLTCTDNDDATGNTRVTVTVTAKDPPTASITEPASGAVYQPGDSITFTGTCTDTDGTISSYAWTSSIDGPLEITSSFSTTGLSSGAHTITLTCTDNDNLNGTDIITLRVNDPPTVSITSPIGGSVYQPGDSITFTGVGTDIDGTIASYAWTSNIDGALSSASSFSTSDLSVGTHVATLTCTDNDDATGTASVTIRVNSPPSACSIISPADGSVHDVGDSITFTGTGTDTDGTISSYAWTSSIDSALSSASSFSTSDLSVETHVATLTCTDNDGAAATDSVTIKINNYPTASIILPTDGAFSSRSDIISFEGTGTDTDGTIKSYAWTSSKGDTLPSTNYFSASGLSAGTHVITLTVTDNDDATDTDSVTININDLPRASITSPASGAEYSQTDTAAFAGTCTDTDGTITSYAWTSSIDGALSSATSFSTTDLLVGTHVATLTCTDNDGAAGSASIIITQTEYDVDWLMQNIDARLGAAVQVEFTVHSPITGEFIIDDSVVVKVYDPDMVEVFRAVHGIGSTDVRIDADREQYVTNFPSSRDASTGTYTIKAEFTSDRPNTNFETTLGIHTRISKIVNTVTKESTKAVKEVVSRFMNIFSGGDSGAEAETPEIIILEEAYEGIRIITDYDFEWLIDKKTQRPGSTVPIKFTVHSPITGGFVIDDTVVVRVYDPDMNVVFRASYAKEDVRIDAETEQYIANFQTQKDAPRGTYTIEVEFANAPDKFETTVDIHTRTSKVVDTVVSFFRRLFGR